MSELFDATLKFHASFAGILFFVAIINYFVIKSGLEYKVFVKRIRTILPIYYMFLTTILFTGLVLLGVSQFEIHYVVYFMVVIWLVVLVTTIKIYKKFKPIRSKDFQAIEELVRFSKKKHLADMALILTTIAIAYMTK